MDARGFWEDCFLKEVPEFEPEYQQELEDEFGELLCHLMLGVVLLPFLETNLKQAQPAPDHAQASKKERKAAAGDLRRVVDTIRRALLCLERGLAEGGHDLQEAIIVSFVENVVKHERSGRLSPGSAALFRSLFGPNLSTAAIAVEAWLDQPWWQDGSQPYKFIHWEPVKPNKSRR